MAKLDSIKMKTILIQKIDCLVVMDNIKQIKSLIDPCELRIRQLEQRNTKIERDPRAMMNERTKDMRHPFLYLPNFLRELMLIGTQDEVRTAER